MSQDTANSSATRLCLTVTNTRACDPNSFTCCMGDITAPVTKYSKLILTTANVSGCTLDKAVRSKLYWTVGSRKRAARYSGLDIVVPVGVSGTTSICLEYRGDNSNCDVHALFVRDSLSHGISYQLETVRTTKKLDAADKATWTKKLACCLTGSISAVCEDDTCTSHQLCDNSTGVAVCKDCPSGFKARNNTCVDIDECSMGTDNCTAKQTCINVNGSYICGPFKITLINAGSDTSHDSVFEAAAAHWESIILKDLPDYPNPSKSDLIGDIGNTQFSYTGPVDDVVIAYVMENIDGPNKELGNAGPIITRLEDNTPVSGYMRFDTSDVGITISEEDFKAVVLHEMGHVLGIGTVWVAKGCIGTCTPGSNKDVFYKCAAAQREYNAAGCSGSLPIETELGQGSGCMHWREKSVITELMSPVLNKGKAMPLSRITVGALEDIYGPNSVNYLAADNYSCPSARTVEAYHPPQEILLL